MSFICTEKVSKTYTVGNEHVHALTQLTLSIEQGEFAAIMGPSGSGKSTILSTLGGLQHPTVGRMTVDGIDVYSLGSEKRADFRREYIGFVFQSFQLIPYLTVLENVLLPLATSSLRRSEQKTMAFEILHNVGLDAKAHRLSDELSGGEQQRAAIARALINQPPIILADEPTGNLDTSTGEEVMKLLQALHKEGHTVVIVTHNSENLRFVTRCIKVQDGHVVN
jgi:putative ABC transport system ATP-binding protein